MQSFDSEKYEINVKGIVPLNPNESKYIKPLRIHYSQNGKSLTWDCMKVHDSVAILLFNSSRNTLIFVRQYRPAVYLASQTDNPHIIHDNPIDKTLVSTSKIGYTLELCAGIIDKDDKSSIEIAKEEILEETGYDVPLSSIQFLSSYRSGVGVTGSLQELFFCSVSDDERVNSGGGIGEEQIDVVELSIDECKKLLLCRDDEAICSRPASMLLAISWFIYEYFPKLSTN